MAALPVISNPTLLLLYIIKSLLIVKNQGVKLARDMMIKDTVMLTYLGLVQPACKRCEIEKRLRVVYLGRVKT